MSTPCTKVRTSPTCRNTSGKPDADGEEDGEEAEGAEAEAGGECDGAVPRAIAAIDSSSLPTLPTLLPLALLPL